MNANRPNADQLAKDAHPIHRSNSIDPAMLEQFSP